MKSLSRLGTFVILGFAVLLSACPKKQAKSDGHVVIWHWMTDREEAFNTLAAKYNEETGADVQFQLYAPSDAYTQKVRVGAQTDTLPEVYGILGEIRDLASFIKAGHVEKLDETFGEGAGSWKSRFYPEALATTEFRADNRFEVEPGFYGVPLDVTTIPMIYNPDLFKKAGLDPENPPQSWTEFLEAGKKLEAAGITGFVSGWGETWLIYALATDLAVNVMGHEKLMATFRGEISYSSEEWQTVFGAFEAMEKAGIADKSIVTLANKNAEKKFASGRAGMTFNGSWAVNVYAGMNPNLSYKPFRPPFLVQGNVRPVWGGAGTVFHVNPKSPNRDAAVEFLKWFTQPEQAAYLLEQTRNLPTVRLDGVKVSPILDGFAKLMENSIHPNRFTSSEDPRVVEAFTKGIQSILIAEKSPKQVAKEIEELKASIAARS